MIFKCSACGHTINSCDNIFKLKKYILCEKCKCYSNFLLDKNNVNEVLIGYAWAITILLLNKGNDKYIKYLKSLISDIQPYLFSE